MAAIPTSQVSPAGTVESLAAANGGGDTFTPDVRSMLSVKNASGGSITVTLAAIVTASDHNSVIPANAVAVAAGTTRDIGPLDPAIYTGAVTYSGVTSLTVAVKRL